MFRSAKDDNIQEKDGLLVNNGNLVTADFQEQQHQQQQQIRQPPRVSFVHPLVGETLEHNQSRLNWLTKRSMSDCQLHRRIVRETTTHREDVSAWTTESNTPMTSQPHFVFFRDVWSRSSSSFDDAHHNHRSSSATGDDDVHASLVRFRSRSLGSSHDHLPLLTHDVNGKQGHVATYSNNILIAVEEKDMDKQEHDPAVVSSHQPLSLKPQDVASSSSSTTTATTTPFWICVMYGLINATIVIPIVISFTSIIYRDRAFANYMPLLVKLVVISGMIHQVCFSSFSSLNFCVGSVQDAGLIFLSSMASDIVAYCRQHGHGDDVLLATTTIGLPIGAALLGVALVVIGRLKLAQYVQMLPTCVVGGYLAYIGWFCGMAGVSLMIPPSTATTTSGSSSSGGSSSSPPSDSTSFVNNDAGAADDQLSESSSDVSLAIILENWEFISPGVIGGMLLYMTVRRLKHMAVLPCSIAFLLLIFYIVLFIRGSTVAEVTQKGWIRVDDNASFGGGNGVGVTYDCAAATHNIWQTWRYLRFDLVAWKALPRLLFTEVSMIFVVALSSSLDVAAIEIEMGKDLEFNRELQTVGWSNIISGCTGGYTGSYIFSQSIFSLRAGIRSRVAGFVLAGAQLLFLILPFNLLAFVPNFFFGSLLVMICVDLVYEWLWDVRNKVSPVEYFVCLLTFVGIQLTTVEGGILFGVVLYLICRQLQSYFGGHVHAIATTTATTDESHKNSTMMDANGNSDNHHTSQQTATNGKSYGSMNHSS